MNNLQIGDILSWNDHSMYVHYWAQTLNDVVVSQKIGDGELNPVEGPSFQGGAYTYDIAKSRVAGGLSGNPTKIYRKRNSWDIKVQNNFGQGKVLFNGDSVQSGDYVTGLDWEEECDIEAYENNKIWDYKKIFKYWDKPIDNENCPDEESSVIILGKPTEERILTANYNNAYEINCYNNFTASQQSGEMKVNGVIYNNIVSASPILTEQYTPISLEAIDQYDDGIEYHFDHWDNQSTSKSRTFTPTGNQIVTAYFSAHRPENVSGIQVVSGYGEYVELSWNEHENDDCSYRIYRKVKDHQGNTTTSLVATRSLSSTSWTDMSYTKEVSGQVLWYDVRAYYNGSISMDYQEAPAGWDVVLYGDSFRSEQKPNIDTKSLAIIPENNATVYPNPFNATTIISYNIKDNSIVSLIIYDISGKEVRYIDNGYKNKGTYRHTWDGCDNQGNLLPTGLYFYHLVANNKSESFKKTGKILMVK